MNLSHQHSSHTGISAIGADDEVGVKSGFRLAVGFDVETAGVEVDVG